MPKWYLINLIVGILFLSTKDGISQSFTSDILLLQQHQLKKSDQKLSTQKGTIGLLYRKHIHAQLGAQCYYEQNCFDFSKGSFREFGMLKGFFLSVDRIGRCNGISRAEILPSRLSRQNLIIETARDYRFRP